MNRKVILSMVLMMLFLGTDLLTTAIQEKRTPLLMKKVKHRLQISPGVFRKLGVTSLSLPLWFWQRCLSSALPLKPV